MAVQETTFDETQIYFSAALRPNRSLSRFGFRILIIFAALLAFGIGGAFFLVGAWPVLGFCGFEILLLYLAFRLNYRAGNACEQLCLTNKALEITRVNPYGKARKWRLEPTWLQVRMDKPPEHHSKLQLRSHGRSLTIGSFLTPEERLEVAEALKTALHNWRPR